MLRAVRLPVEFEGFWWTINPLTGSLLRHVDKPNPLFDDINKKIRSALEICEHPFNCEWSPTPIECSLGEKKIRQLNQMHERLLWIGSDHFFLSLLYAGIKSAIFGSTKEAMSEIALVPEQAINRDERCLQRSLLAAKTSASFKQNGVLLIGAIPDNGDMHAWIIESESQPDHMDRGWINYMPMLAIVES
jgi:hypothetical protein